MMRGRKEWDVRDYWEGGEFDLTSTSAASDREQLVRKVSRISFRSRGQEQSHPLTIPDLEGLLANPATIMAEYSVGRLSGGEGEWEGGAGGTCS